jgi:glycosyltransferase involved in cell wall biosynthesis
VVYVYYQGDFINLWALWLCRLMNIPTVQEACEWWPGTASSKPFNEWIYRNIMFRWSNGAMPISREIQDRIRFLAGPDYPLCRVPVLVDPAEHSALSKEGLNGDLSGPVLFWCGMVDGYKRDVLFLIDAMAELKSNAGQNSLFCIAGPCSEGVRAELLSYASSKGIAAERIVIAGFVSETELWNYCTHADALLMPLWDDDRSLTRFPTKFGQFLAAGRPIVTSRIGEIKYFLTDDTAVFYPPGDAAGLAISLDRLLTNQALGKQLASHATREVLPKVDFRLNASRISNWFSQIYSRFQHA